MFNNVAKLHIFFETTKKIKRNLQVINELPQNQHFNNPIHLWQGGPIPQNMAKTFDDPPTLERSGSERRGGAVSSLFPEGERVGVRGGALFNGKEGRGDFRKNLLPLRIFVQITLIIMCFMMCARKQIA